MGALTIDANIINAPGLIGLWALGGGGLFVLLIVLLLLANLTGKATLWTLVPGLIGLVAVELALFLVRKQTITLGNNPALAATLKRFSEETRFWAFVGQVSIPIVFLLAVRAMMMLAHRRLHDQVPVLLQSGIQHLFQREYNEAVQEFSAAIKIEPGRAELYWKRGTAFELLNEYDLALADYERALARDARLMEVYLRRGALRTARGDCAAALVDFQQVLSIRPNDVECHLQRGLCLLKDGRARDATVEFEKVLRLTNNPDFAEPARRALQELGAGPNHTPQSRTL